MQKLSAGKFHWRPLPDAHAKIGGRATRAWIDRTNDGLSGMPAEGTSACRQKRGTSARPAGRLESRLHHHATKRKGHDAHQTFQPSASSIAASFNANGRSALA